AIREPWRLAAAYLADAGQDVSMIERGVSTSALKAVQVMIERRLNAPLSSSMGRLFDAVAALAGVRHEVSYEGQAAIELEWLASRSPPGGASPFDIVAARQAHMAEPTLALDMRPMIAEVVTEIRRGVGSAEIGRRFHSTIVELIANVCARLRAVSGLNAVVLSGGVFLNALLTTEAVARLASDGFQVYRHRRVPPNDGGLSLGQLAVAAARCSNEGVTH